MRKAIVSLLLSAVMLLAITACGATASSGQASSSTASSSKGSSTAAASGEKTKISVLRPGDQEKVELFMEPAIEAFMVENPDIEVEIVYEAWGGWLQTYPTMFENNTQPDVILWWDNKQMDSSAADRLQPLNDVVDQAVFDKLPDSIWSLADIGKEEIYYVPSSVDAFLLIYNKDVFEAAGLDPDTPPATWDELLAACEAITANTDIPALGVPAKAGLDTLQEFYAQFITQKTGTDMLDAENQPTFNTAAGLEALDFIGQLRPHMIPAASDFGRGDMRPMLRDGQLGMIIDSAWAVPTFTEAFGDDLDQSPIMIAAPPIPSGGEKTTWAGTNGWVATRPETLEASGKLISWMMSDEMLYAHHKAYGSIPLTEYEMAQEFYQYDYWNRMNGVLGDFKLIGMIGKYSTNPSAYYAELEPVEQLYLLDQLDAQQTMDAMVEAIDTINARQA